MNDRKKDKYIIASLGSIGRNKRWELYVVSRIIHLLGDDDLEFACQKYVKHKNDSDEYSLTDLCFPSLGLYIEVNEKQHDGAKEEDKKRQQAIYAATSWEQLDIDIYEYRGETKKYKSLDDINKIIDRVILQIKEKKAHLVANGETITWDYGKKYDPETYRKRNNGVIDVKHNVVVKYMWQAMSLFGRESQKHPFKGYWHIPRTNETVWCPKLYDFAKDGLIWKNSITDNDKKIIMKKEKNGEFVEVPKALNRAIVFAHQKNLLGQVEYRFYGVFEPSNIESDKYQQVYSLKKSSIDLEGYKKN